MALPPNVNVGVGIARPPRPQRARRRPILRGRVVGRPQAGLPRPKPVVKPKPTVAQAVAAPAKPVPPPQTAAGADIRTQANEAFAGARNTWRDSVYRAAMELGDPAAIARLQNDPAFAGYKFATDPNSTFATLARGQVEGNQAIDNSQAQNNTFFSGLRLNDRNKLAAETDRGRASAVTSYQDALRDYAAALSAAQGGYNTDIRAADRTDLEAALAMEPEATGQLPKAKPKPKPKAKKPAKKKPPAKKPRKKK